jgi:hypothetical protein
VAKQQPPLWSAILQTESSTHTIVVKESLSGETDDEDDEYQAEDRSSDFNSTAIVVLPNNKNDISSTSSLAPLPSHYEDLIVKLEKDIR